MPIQKLYLHDAASSDTGTLPGASTISVTSPSKTASGASTNRSLTGAIGAAQVAAALGVNNVSADSSDWLRRFLSAPLGAQTLPAGTWTMSRADSGSGSLQGATDNVLGVWRPSTGALVGLIFDQVPTTSAPGATESSVSDSCTGAALAIQDGDILVLELWWSVAPTATVAGPTTYYDGTVEGSTSSNAANLVAPASLLLSGESAPSSSGIFASVGHAGPRA